mmetsp:Transcript_6689/g.15019  ORF Transcript_6689/g.15019 Transcript_6689/m.15019 type:complete len:86 (-) Transcript_6689:74-331(-)
MGNCETTCASCRDKAVQAGLTNAKGALKDKAAKEIVASYAPASLKPCLGCCSATSQMSAIERLDFMVPQDKRAQCKQAIAAYKSI